ncbi:hypothetical protein Q31a_32740 [Aureliella helgolandensis]|uniref:Uncharacterized protein n=1 Tax=Aureliella helgolandensis TaxID=2527968 RepID=A0A518G8P4_9BACT|nr:hypothetical protein Q31a_32740 [Aureliella helgolandensis]
MTGILQPFDHAPQESLVGLGTTKVWPPMKGRSIHRSDVESTLRVLKIYNHVCIQCVCSMASERIAHGAHSNGMRYLKWVISFMQESHGQGRTGMTSFPSTPATSQAFSAGTRSPLGAASLAQLTIGKRSIAIPRMPL